MKHGGLEEEEADKIERPVDGVEGGILNRQNLTQIWNNLKKLTPLEQLTINIHDMLGHVSFTTLQQLAKAE